VLSGEKKPFAIFIPPPNVTGALHLGHALNNTLQDTLTRFHRMRGYEALWMPGTDHAGIATQAVVEKRLRSEGQLKGPLKDPERNGGWTREKFVAKIQDWKDEYEARITEQLRAMGCSCDFDRQRFTMDPVCARAVREAFFILFRDGLIYRGKRLVNWDPALQTAVADDECYEEEIDTSFWYLKYPLTQPVKLPTGETIDHVTVATTRPETYLGDTAVAINPHDPRAKALVGQSVRLPLVGRVIPIVADEYVVLPKAMAETLGRHEDAKDPKAEFATGFLKVTPAHDQNDYDLGQRHKAAIERNSAGKLMINMMSPDGKVSDQHGWSDTGDAKRFVGMTMAQARKAVVQAFEEAGLLEKTRPYRQTVTKSDRSKAQIEPYLSDQWYVRVTDAKMAPAANAALKADQVRFVPERYGKTFEQWHNSIRDWCISRQLWWGHRIPVWHATLDRPIVSESAHSYELALQAAAADLESRLNTLLSHLSVLGRCAVRVTDRPESGSIGPSRFAISPSSPEAGKVLDCLLAEVSAASGEEIPSEFRLRSHFAVNAAATSLFTQLATSISHLEQDPDVLDTWFSSALWPLSTLGWPDPAAATRDVNGAVRFEGLLEAFNPSSVLSTAREIITLWVSRMVMMNRYLLPEGWPASLPSRREGPGVGSSGGAGTSGASPTPTPPSGRGFEPGAGRGPVPFRDVFIHAVVQDGNGQRMSKSAGNGVDPLDIIATHGADALRFTLCQMTTQTQDVRMPVVKDSATGKNTSPRFDLGRNFGNKLWNAARFAMSMLEAGGGLAGAGLPARPSAAGAHARAGSPGPAEAAAIDRAKLSLADRWMLSRLARGVQAAEQALAGYEFAGYAQTLYELLWNDFCDWYLEAIKPTVSADPGTRAVLRHSLDVLLRLLHPVMPFVTEAVHEAFGRLPAAPAIDGLNLGHTGELLALSGWPTLDHAKLIDPAAEREFGRLQGVVTAVREGRARQNVKPSRKITLHVPAALKQEIGAGEGLVSALAGLEKLTDAAVPAGVPAAVVPLEAMELFISNFADAIDQGAERERLERLIGECDKAIAALDGRLNNPGYAERAPAHLVQQTRDQRTAKAAERDAAKAALERLG
jgi:valyl-tRNA synthetase